MRKNPELKPEGDSTKFQHPLRSITPSIWLTIIFSNRQKRGRDDPTKANLHFSHFHLFVILLFFSCI